MSTNMQYRRLGRSGLQVSLFSLGSWVSFGDQIGIAEATDCMQAAYDAGVNFFDNAESYAGGESERIMGAAIPAPVPRASKQPPKQVAPPPVAAQRPPAAVPAPAPASAATATRATSKQAWHRIGTIL